MRDDGKPTTSLCVYRNVHVPDFTHPTLPSDAVASANIIRIRQGMRGSGELFETRQRRGA